MKSKHYIFPAIGILLLLTLLTSCRKAPINGKLDGMWQVMDIEYSDGTRASVDYQAYYCIELHVVQLRGLSGQTGNLHYADNKLTMDFPYVDTEAKLKSLKTYGIEENPQVFDIVTLTRSTLVMRSTTGSVTVTCRKF